MYLQVSGKLNQFTLISTTPTWPAFPWCFPLSSLWFNSLFDEADEGSLTFVRSSSQGSQHRSLGLSVLTGALGANSNLGY